MDSIEIKPGALTKDRTRGLALAFGDPRCYMQRLDEVIGPDDWSVAYEILPQSVICRLAILGHTRQDVGDYPTDGGDYVHDGEPTDEIPTAVTATVASVRLLDNSAIMRRAGIFPTQSDTRSNRNDLL